MDEMPMGLMAQKWVFFAFGIGKKSNLGLVMH